MNAQDIVSGLAPPVLSQEEPPRPPSAQAEGQRAPGFWSYACVLLLYLAVHLFIFRGVVTALPDLLTGRSVLNTSELVPFFAPTAQFIEQAGGAFSELTNQYEFRVRYSILTTWMRYYLILPFAIILTPVLGAFLVTLAVTAFLRKLLPSIPSRRILAATALATLLVHLLLLPAKVTHFYTLILGFDLFVVALTLLLRGLFLEQRHPFRMIAFASILALLNPTVHFLVLYPITVAFLSAGTGILLLIAGGRQRSSSSSRLWKRLLMALAFTSFLTLLPYGLFVKFYVLRGIPNLTDVVPDTVESIRANSISLLRQITFDFASATDNYLRGAYISPSPRFGKIFYFLLALVPFLISPARTIQERRRLSPLLILLGGLLLFSMWCSIGYADTLLFPTFHTILAAIANRLYLSATSAAEMGIRVITETIHILRFPDRFQFITLAMITLLMPMGILTVAQACMRGVLARRSLGHLMGTALCAVIFFLPLFAHWEYRLALLSGDFGGFLRPYPVQNLREIKDTLQTLPSGKTVVLPPSESPWIGQSSDGEDYKFIDKFFIYFLNVPSFYFGLSGNLENKYAFYLLSQALSLYEHWWVNIARNLRIRYLIVNKELTPPAQSPWYMQSITRGISEQPKRMPQYFRKIRENASFALYEFIDPQAPDAPEILTDLPWTSFQCLEERTPSLTRDYRTLPLSAALSPEELPATILAEDSEKVRLDLSAKMHPDRFFRPDQSSFAFNPDHLPSTHYFGTIFPMLNLLTANAYNLFQVVMPGPFDTLTSTFVGLRKHTTIRFPLKVPENGTYEILLRGVATQHSLAARSDEGAVVATTVGKDDTSTRYVSTESVPFGLRAPFDLSSSTPETLSSLIPQKAMPVSNQFSYVPLGTFDLREGKHWFYLTKHDENPLIVEGILLLPIQKQEMRLLPSTIRFLTPTRLSQGHG